MQPVTPTSVYLVPVRDCVVSLDLKSGRYRLYQGDAASVLQRVMAGETTSGDQQWLACHDIDAATVAPGARVRRPTCSLVTVNCTAGRLDVPRALWMQRQVQLQLRRQPLQTILQSLEAVIATTAPGMPSQYDRAAAVFRQAGRVRSKEDQCLVRGIAMARFLARSGVRSELIIGVKLPFAAHCWVQRDDAVLSDTVDAVRGYTPILQI